MGIDIYMRWPGQSIRKVRFTDSGAKLPPAYLRESYSGGPYATRVLVPEAFEADAKGVTIPAATLRSRLLETMRTAIDSVARDEARRASESPLPELEKIRKTVTIPIPAWLRSFIEFVELAEKRERKTGKPVRIIASW